MVKILIFFIKIYRFFSCFAPPTCRFQESCSLYAINSLQKYGTLKGITLILRRLLSCHPFH